MLRTFQTPSAKFTVVMASDMVDERSSLLPPPSPAVKDEATTCSHWHDLILLSKQTIPICLSFALQNGVQAICVLTAGSLGSFELEVTSYGFMFYSCTGSMVAIGGATALDTLCAQAFTSHTVTDNPKELGLLLQQCLLALLGIFAVLIAPIWVYSGRIFTALGQEPEFAHVTGRFVLFMLPAGVLQVVAECLRKFLQVQGESNIVGVATGAASVVAIVIEVVLVKGTRLHLWGGPCAFAIYQLIAVIILLGVIAYKPTVRKTWHSSTSGMLQGFPRMLFYAVTGIMTIATEWWR